jgi:pimeloyl-ACP methyl ester carboxylesterase
LQEQYVEAEQQLFADFGIPTRSRFVDLPAPALRARVVECGEGDPLILMHGGGASAAFWAPLLAHLSGFRLIAVDRPGCGLSDPFDYHGVNVHEHAVAFCSWLLDALELPSAQFVSTSTGSQWSLSYAGAQPERVRRHVLIGCPFLLLDNGAPFGMRLLSVPGLNRLMTAMEPPTHRTCVRQMRRLGERPEVLAGLPASLEATFIALLRVPAWKLGWLSLMERMLQLTGSGARAEYCLGQHDLERASQPTLYLWGEQDVFASPAVGRQAAAMMPNAKLIEVPAAGHIVWFDAPAQCAAAIRDHLASPIGEPAT